MDGRVFFFTNSAPCGRAAMTPSIASFSANTSPENLIQTSGIWNARRTNCTRMNALRDSAESCADQPGRTAAAFQRAARRHERRRPAPPIPYEVERYELWHRKRLDMKPGITGLWQVSGRNRLPFDEMVRMDLYYIENWSLLLDLKIILQTLPVMWRGDDALYEGRVLWSAPLCCKDISVDRFWLSGKMLQRYEREKAIKELDRAPARAVISERSA